MFALSNHFFLHKTRGVQCSFFYFSFFIVFQLFSSEKKVAIFGPGRAGNLQMIYDGKYISICLNATTTMMMMLITCNVVSKNQLNVFKFDELDYRIMWQSSPVNDNNILGDPVNRTHEQYLFTVIFHVSVDFIFADSSLHWTMATKDDRSIQSFALAFWEWECKEKYI